MLYPFLLIIIFLIFYNIAISFELFYVILHLLNFYNYFLNFYNNKFLRIFNSIKF